MAIQQQHTENHQIAPKRPVDERVEFAYDHRMNTFNTRKISIKTPQIRGRERYC